MRRIYYSLTNVLGQDEENQSPIKYMWVYIEHFHVIRRYHNGEGRIVERKENNKDFFNGEPLNTISCFVCCLPFYSRHSDTKKKKNFLMRERRRKKTVYRKIVGRFLQTIVSDNSGEMLTSMS